jgi:flavodoxin
LFFRFQWLFAFMGFLYLFLSGQLSRLQPTGAQNASPAATCSFCYAVLASFFKVILENHSYHYGENLNNALMSKSLIMKLGIIVHSQTGHTLSVAQTLKEKLAAAGHSVNIEQITPVDAKQTDPKNIRLEKLPDLSSYDALVLAAPVQAFSVSPVMKAYLPQLPSLNNKKVALFVTKGLPFVSTGGNQAISLMKSTSESKGGTVVGTAILNWPAPGREKRIADLVEQFSKLF